MMCSCCNQIMKFTKKYYADAKCNNCGIHLPKSSCLQICPDYNLDNPVSTSSILCVNCRICFNRHNVRKVFNLTPHASSMGGLYKINEFACDVCQERYVVDKNKGVMHCLHCKFDLCENCEKNYEKGFAVEPSCI